MCGLRSPVESGAAPNVALQAKSHGRIDRASENLTFILQSLATAPGHALVTAAHGGIMQGPNREPRGGWQTRLRRRRLDHQPSIGTEAADATRFVHERAPSRAALVHDLVNVAIEPRGERSTFEEAPYALRRAQFRAVCRQRHQRDGGRHHEIRRRGMKARAVDQHGGMMLGNTACAIRARCALIASAQTVSTTIDTPVSRSGQKGLNRQADLKPPCTNARGLLPFSAQRLTTLPFWPTRVSSCTHTSIALASG